jgi:predicted nucleic acid-binding protein
MRRPKSAKIVIKIYHGNRRELKSQISSFGGNPRKIIDLWKNGQVTICLAPAIIEEYLAVLRRLGLEGEPEIGELIDLFAKGHHLLFTAKTPELKIVHGDPADDKFIGCAVALKAEAIVSGDKRLQEVGDYMRIKILGPGGFLSLFSAAMRTS